MCQKFWHIKVHLSAIFFGNTGSLHPYYLFHNPTAPTNVKVCFGKSFTAITQHWMGRREGGIFVESSECYEGAIITAEKMPCRVNVSTTFVTYGSSHKVQVAVTGAVIRIIATSNAAASNAQTGQRSHYPFNKFHRNGTPMQPRCKSLSGCGHRVKRNKDYPSLFN